MGAQVLQGGILPEVEAALDLEISAVKCAGITQFALGGIGEIMVDEPESVAELVRLEHLEGGGNVLTVLSEVVEDLEVGLGFCTLGKSEHRNGGEE